MLVKKPVDPVNKQEAKLGQGTGSSLSDKTRGSSQYYEDSSCSARKQDAIMPVLHRGRSVSTVRWSIQQVPKPCSEVGPMNKAEGTQLQMGSKDLGQEACYLGQEARGANQLEKEAKSTQKETVSTQKETRSTQKEAKSTKMKP